jgi:hypothetical protein
MLIILYALPAGLTLTSASIVDHDIWSHIRTGQWIVAHGWVPYADWFSSYGMGKPWVAYSWLFELLIYGVFSRLGLLGLLVYVYVLVLSITAVLHSFVRKLVTEVAHAVVLTALALFAMLPLYTPRPWLFTILFFAIELNILVGVRHSRRYRVLLFLPLLFALWANLHIQFIYGLFVLGLFALEDPLNRLAHRRTAVNEEQDKPLPVRRMALITAACLIVTLVNPYHFRIYLVVLDYVRQPGLYNLIREYAAMNFRTAPNWFVLFFTLGATFALGRHRVVSPFWILLVLVGALVSFRSARDAWFVVTIAVVVICSSRSAALVNKRYVLSKAETLVVTAAVGILLLLAARVAHVSEGDFQIAVARTYPVEAANVVEERGYPGPLYNHYNWGGYLIWRLPRLPVSIDGRTNVHDVDRVTHSLAVWNGKPNWASDPELSAARLVIAQKDLPLTQLLRLDPRFELTYEDQVAVVFIAKTKE